MNNYLGRLREQGWMVAIHNDYRQDGEAKTFWLFTHPDGRWIKGEGKTDDEAIDGAVLQLRALNADRAHLETLGADALELLREPMPRFCYHHTVPAAAGACGECWGCRRTAWLKMHDAKHPTGSTGK